MKKQLLAITLILTSIQCQAQESWLDKIKSMLGMESEQVQSTAASLDFNSMIAMLSDNLSITSEQAEGGLAAILNYIKQTSDSAEFKSLTQDMPGIESVLSAVPAVPTSVQQTGLGSLLDKAAEYSGTAKALNDLKKQFEAIGLKPETIQQFITQINSYLDTPEGQEARKLFSESMLKLGL